MSRRGAAVSVDAFLERFGEEAPEVIWTAALAWLERAAGDARRVAGSRWRHYPQGEVRRLRDEIAAALMLARLAVALQEDANTLERELVRDARRAAAAQRRADKRAMTIEAERARLRKARPRHRVSQGKARARAAGTDTGRGDDRTDSRACE